MSLPKAQLVDPQGNMNLPGMTATGIVTASSLKGVTTGSATGLTGNPDLDVGIVTASSFVGQGDGHAANLTGTPQLNLGVTTSTGFIGDAVGKAAGLTGTPNLNVGLITGTSFVGFVTGDVTGNISGLAVSVTPGVNLGVGVCTAIQYHGDGSALTGVAASAYIAQEITATGAETIIDLSYGNLIYYDSSSNTTIGFASTSPAEQITFIRKPTNSYTITWPDRVKWNNDTTPTLINNPRTSSSQIFRFTTFDTGLSYNAWEEIKTDTSTSALFSWGYNPSGQLGQNSRTSYSSPKQVGTDTTWGELSAGAPSSYGFGMTLKTDNTLWVWGKNGYGQLALNDNADRSSPVQIPGDWSWKTGVRGTRRGSIVKTDGTLWIWGYNVFGDLGLNDTTDRSSPCQIPGTTWNKLNKGGSYGNFGIKTDGSLWAWGNNNNGRGGLNHNYRISSPVQVGTDTTWAVATWGYCSVAIKTDGTLWSWGDPGDYGTGGRNLSKNPSSPWTQYSSPIQVGTDTTWSQLSQANNACWAIKTDGTLWSWGMSSNGQLGQNDYNYPGSAPYNPRSKSSPVQIGTDTTWSSLAHGCAGSMYALKSDNTLWAWGNNGNGKLGLNQSSGKISSPTQVPGTNWGQVEVIGYDSINALKLV